MRPAANVHRLPVKPLVISIQGQTYYSAPILAIINKTYTVSGDVEFTPSRDETYVIKGKLGDAGSSVWIENSKGSAEGED